MAGVKFKKTLKGDEYVIYECPNCDASLNSPIDEIGIQDTCPECDSPFIVPGTEHLEARRNAARLKKEEAEAVALLRKQEQEQRAYEAEVAIRVKKEAQGQSYANNANPQQADSIPSQSQRTTTSTAELDLYFSNKAMFAANPIGFLLTLLLIPVFGIGLLILIVWFIDCQGSSLTVTNKRSILRSGILSKHTSEVLHKDVRNLQVSQGIINRMFGVGSIAISSAGQSDFEIYIRGVTDPYKAKSIIDDVRLS